MQTIEIKFTQDELNALVALMDAGVKAVGLASVTNAAVLLQKLQTAAQAQLPKKDDAAEELKDAA